MSRLGLVRASLGALSGLAIVVLALSSPRAIAGGAGSCGIEGPAADPPAFLNCAACHFPVAVNSGDGDFRFEGLPNEWTPNATYRIAGVLSDPGQSLWGFKATIIDSTGANAGTLVPADGNTRLCVIDSRCYLSQAGGGRFPGTTDGPVRWEFDWTAPSAGTGRIAAYGVGIACNNDNGESGDFTYTTAASSIEAGAPSASVSILLQPDDVTLAVGDDLVARVRVTNHGAAPKRVFVATRARLPSGGFFPQSGFLQESPVRLDLAPFESRSVTFAHPVRSGAGGASAVYEALVGASGEGLIAISEAAITVE